MYVYLPNILLMFIWGFLLLLVKPNDKKKHAYCLIVCLQWTLISGLRHISVGDDTMGYGVAFERVKNMSWSEVFNRIWIYIFGADIKDPGYTLLQKIFQIFSKDYQIFLLFIAFFFTFAMAIWIYNNSDMPCLSFVIYSTMFFSFFAVTGHRQTIATAIVVFIGYKFIKERKPIPFFLLCFLAFFIHKSIAVYAPFYFIANKKITPKYIGVVSLVCAVFLLGGRRTYNFFVQLLAYDDYDVLVRTPLGYVLFISIVSVVAFIMYPKIKKNRLEDYEILYNALILTLLFTLLTIREQTFMRIQQYYALYLMIIVPEIMKFFDKKTRVLVYALTSAVLILRMISSHAVYKFFWM